MQASTSDRFLNMQIFAQLLRCIREICIQKFITHLAMVDIRDGSQTWYRKFFRLAGFRRCRCQRSTGSAVQVETRNCLGSKQSLDGNSSAVYRTVMGWLVEGRCTSALLASIASGEAAEVERIYFHDLLAKLEKKRSTQGGSILTSKMANDRMHTPKSRLESVQRVAALKTKAQKPQSGPILLRKQWPIQDTVKDGTGDSAYRVTKKRKWKGTQKRVDSSVPGKHTAGGIG